MTIVCLDTHIIQWGVLNRVNRPSEEHYIEKASRLFQLIDSQGYEVIIPAIIIGELLIPLPKEKYSDALNRLSRDWQIVDYDLNAAAHFANLRSEKAIQNIRVELEKTGLFATRKHLIADYMIAATAISHGAKIIYTNDRPMKNTLSDVRDCRVELLDDFVTGPEQFAMFNN